MRAVVQRVLQSSVQVDGETIGKIGKGINVLLGVGVDDTEADATYLAEKILHLRIFDDPDGKMNISLLDIQGELLVISQFTLYGDCRKGKRPGYDKAASPGKAEELYRKFVEHCKGYSIKVETGKFRATMKVDIQNDGPVTLILDSQKLF